MNQSSFHDRLTVLSVPRHFCAEAINRVSIAVIVSFSVHHDHLANGTKAAVLNGRVYIDGGEVSYYSGTDITFQYCKTLHALTVETMVYPNSSVANSLLSIDLSQDWTSDSVRFDSTSKPSGAANLAGGGLWVDETDGVLYTGFAGTKSNFGDNADQPQGLWSFKPDGTGGGTWQNLNNTADKTFTEQPRPYKGKTASGNGFGYFLGGM